MDRQHDFGLMTESEAAELLNVSASTLLRARKACKLEFFRIGWKVYYDQRQLRDYVEQHCAGVKRTYRRATAVPATAVA